MNSSDVHDEEIDEQPIFCICGHHKNYHFDSGVCAYPKVTPFRLESGCDCKEFSLSPGDVK